MKFNRKNVVKVINEYIDCADYVLTQTHTTPYIEMAYKEKISAYKHILRDITEME